MKFPQAKISGEGVPEITCEDLSGKLAEVHLIDVRRPDEFTGELGHIEQSRLSTLEGSFGADINTWPRNEAYVFVCRSGMRSARAASYAQSLGFTEVYNLVGGMIDWNATGRPIVT